ncbi:MAG: hypothetical protein IBX70_12015 [Clostridia bacterium]|nr:hypothetical protein [Clostridia bacterium]
MLKKCEKCGRFFGDEIGGNVCTACRLSTRNFKSSGDPERDKYTAARELVYDNPDISPQGIIDIMLEMGIDISLRDIMKYVDEGRLTLNTAKVGNHCYSCGTKIAVGKYCERCRTKQDLQKRAEKSNEKPVNDFHTEHKVKMHITDKSK